MKRKLFFWVLFCASLVLFCAQTMEAFGVVAFHAEFFEKKGTIIIDAGHGGEDGGAVGVNGLVEKDINLAIALALAEDLKANNFDVVLVRDGDYSVGDQSLSTVAERKRSDTKRRVSLVEETGDCLLVSIHQNQFSQSQYSGAQMFYSPNNEESAQLAECIRQSVVSSLQPENTRQNKEAGEEIYLLTHCQVPAVLVECGFLSNPQEAELLGQETYQNDMAAAIYNGIIDFLEQREEEPA
jgi:N-acetylmuramoyl-L-alanine amidase